MDQGSSLLLGIDGLVVDRVLIDESGRRVVHCSTDPEVAGWCPVCRQRSSSPKDRVTTRPRDVPIGADRPLLLWHKRKWHCRVPECERKVFTEALPEQIPARARISTRARRQVARSIGDHGRPVSSVAGEFEMDWRIAHDAFAAYAEQVLPEGPPPVRVLGLDETRRGKGKYEMDPATGGNPPHRTGPTRKRSMRCSSSGSCRRSTIATPRAFRGAGSRWSNSRSAASSHDSAHAAW